MRRPLSLPLRPVPDTERGFAMIAVVIVLIGVGITVLLTAVRETTVIHTRSQTETMEQLSVVSDALAAYALTIYGLPCPADGEAGDGIADCGTAAEKGVVPWRTLGLRESDAVDRWGRMIAYRPAPTLLSPNNLANNTGHLILCRAKQDCDQTANQAESKAAYVLVSTGPAGQGGFLPGGTRLPDPKNAQEAANLADPASTGIYYDLPFNILDGDKARPSDDDDYFDDIVIARSIDDILQPSSGSSPDFDLNDAEDLAKVAGTTPYKGGGRDVRAPSVGDNPAGDGKAIVFGQQEDGKYTKLDDDGTEDRQTSCVWIDHEFTLTTQTFRAYFVFQFFPGQFYDQTTSDKSTGDGFTFAILPGSTDTTDATTGQICGKAGHNMGLGFKDGIPMPKMAVEFDIYNNNYGDENALRHNHAAILTAWDTDYIGNGSGNNPPCGVGDYSTFGSENPCTFRRAADGFAAPNVIFLEERQPGTVDYVVDGLVAVPYPVRIEIERGCTLGCGADTCGTGGTYMRTKVWIKCTADGCDDTTKDFTGDWTENSINYCHRDPSAYDASTETTFDTIKFGFTMASVGNDTGVLLYDLKASSN